MEVVKWLRFLKLVIVYELFGIPYHDLQLLQYIWVTLINLDVSLLFETLELEVHVLYKWAKHGIRVDIVHRPKVLFKFLAL